MRMTCMQQFKQNLSRKSDGQIIIQSMQKDENNQDAGASLRVRASQDAQRPALDIVKLQKLSWHCARAAAESYCTGIITATVAR